MSDQKEKEQLMKNLERIEPILKNEDAVVHCNFKKTLIAADIHGDERTLEFILKFAEKKKVDSYIFLGDYINKGQESIAVLNTLFELKLKNPEKVILLRGNHETRSLSSWFEFAEDLSGNHEIYEKANRVFEKIPIAAVLNKNIFCVHGCIAGGKEETLKSISKKEPKKYIWNDPGPDDGLSPSPRGSGVYRVGPDLVRNFLKRSELKMIIRGHTSHTEGVRFWFDDSLVSLYSTFPSDNPSFLAAVAVADENEIKFHYYRKYRTSPGWLEEKKKLALKNKK